MNFVAIRNNLDELFSEFDTRGQGVLQQDDVRRLILQWAGNSNPITQRGSFQPPPMLKPTSLPRDEVVAFVTHLDRDGDGTCDCNLLHFMHHCSLFFVFWLSRNLDRSY